MADPGVVDEVLAAGQALQQRLQHLRELLHDMESEFAPLPQQIDTFAWMVEESLPLMRASGPVSSPALTSRLLRRNLKKAAVFVGAVLDGGNSLSGWDVRGVDQELMEIQESVLSTFLLNLFVEKLNINFSNPEDRISFKEALSALELRITTSATAPTSVLKSDPAKTKAAQKSILRIVMAAEATATRKENLESVFDAISTILPGSQTAGWKSFLNIVNLVTAELRHGRSEEHEQKSVTQPRWYQDPLTWETMIDPVKCNDGRTYDRWTIIDNKVTRGPFDNRDPFEIVCDDVDVRGRLFEKFPEQETCYLNLRGTYRDEAFKKLEQQEYPEAIKMLDNVLKWAESDAQCRKMLVAAKCLLEEKNRRLRTFDLNEPTMSDLAMLDVQETPQISGELQSWMGWYRCDSLSFNISLELFVTNQNRLYGHGSDAHGDWVMEGHCTGDDVKFRLQYVNARENQVLYVGKRYFKADGTEYMEGERTRLRNLSHLRGAFYLERVLSSTRTGHGQHWTGYWQDENTNECSTHHSDIVFTSHNKLFGFGTDNEGRSFTYLGTYSQEGNRIIIVFLKLYEPNTDARHVAASCSQYWGRLFKGFAGLPTVAEGNWQSYTENALGGFRLETHSFPAVFPGPSLNSRQTPRFPGVLECWKGWYEEDGFKKSMTASLYLTGSNRLCGYGCDYIGQWTWEGEYVGIHHVLLRKQYVTKPHYRIKYSGTKCFKEGKEILEGTWSIREYSGRFLLEKETSSMKTACGQLWTGYWQFSSGRRGTDDTEFVFTSHNKLFGFGSDMEGSFTHTGTYSQEGNLLKITTLKLYEAGTSPYVIYWGLLHLRFQSSTVMEGKWTNIRAEGEGTFRFETKDFSPELSPPSVTSCVQPPHGVDELEVWEGWYQHSGQRQSTSLVLYVTSSNRLCGYGNDLNGEWTCEGDGDGERLKLRKQYVDKAQSRVVYNGKRTLVDDSEVIIGEWLLDAEAFHTREAQPFYLKKDKTAARTAYGQHWTGYWEMNSDGHMRGLDFTDFVFASNNRVFGFGSDVAGTYTYIGTYFREYYTVKVKMVKLYEPGTSPMAQYFGQIDMQRLDNTTRVMEGSWTNVEGEDNGTFFFQTQDFDLETFISVAGPLGPSSQQDAVDAGEEM